MTNYNIPIYLDIDILLDLLDSLEDGFSTVNKITTNETKNEDSSKKWSLGFGSGQLFNFGFGNSKENSTGHNNTSEN